MGPSTCKRENAVQRTERRVCGEDCSRSQGHAGSFSTHAAGLGMAVFALVLVSAAACLSAGPGEASFLAKSDAAMTRMMAAMKIKPSNDVDKDFVAHDGATSPGRHRHGTSRAELWTQRESAPPRPGNHRHSAGGYRYDAARTRQHASLSVHQT